MSKVPCAGCGKPVYRGPRSRPSPICHECRKRDRQRTCEACGKQYDPGNSNRKYCSKKCSGRETRIGTCRLCGEPFVILARDRLTFCSRKCSYEWLALDKATRPEVKPEPVAPKFCRVRFPACAFCGSVFCSHGRNRKYCSTECANGAKRQHDARRRQSLGRPKAHTTKVCTECRSTFEAKSSTAKYCSNRCRKRGRGYSHHSRARKFGAVRESFGVTEIYARDNWTCGICGERVDPESQWPDQMCPSLDHIIPLSMGGSHVRDNVRCAHWLCNSLRGVTDIDFLVA